MSACNVRVMAILATGLLAGCRGVVTVDLATDAPADPQIAHVLVSLTGLEFRKSDGATRRLEFRTSEPVDLMDYLDGDPLRMFTEEKLSDGTYTGVRLILDADARAGVIDSTGSELPIVFADGNVVEISLTVEQDKSRRESWVLTLDLRKSLSFDAASDEYTLRPLLRSVTTGDAARIAGAVNATCPPGTSLSEGGAVYLFEGSDVAADDLDGNDIEPYATAAVAADRFGQFGYTLRFLPAGDYTLALTCLGDTEDPGENEDLDFRNTVNLRLDAGETLTSDIG